MLNFWFKARGARCQEIIMSKKSYIFTGLCVFFLFVAHLHAGNGGLVGDKKRKYKVINSKDEPLRKNYKDEETAKLKLLLNSFIEKFHKIKDFRINNNHAENIRALIGLGADPNASNDHGSAALHWAAQAGNCPLISFLVSNGADVQAKNTSGSKPLYYAAYNNNIGAFDLLVSLGAPLHSRNNAGQKALDMASDKSMEVLGKYILLEYRLYLAALDGDEDQIKDLLHAGANINFIFRGRTALMSAGINGHKNIVSLLLKNQADAKTLGYVTKSFGYTALMLAIEHDRNEIALELLPFSDVDQMAADGNTALILATKKNNRALVEMLLAAKAHVDLADNDENTPLMWASSKGQLAIINLLLNSGANINHANLKKQTSLWFAAHNNRKDAVRLLLTRKADVELCDIEQKTPLIIALEKGHDDIAKLLERRPAEVRAKEREPNKEIITCSVCLLDIEANNFAKSKCDHTFHLSCISELIFRGMPCPLCRGEMIGELN